MFENRHVFRGKLNNLSVRDLKLTNDKNTDRYRVTSVKERLKILEEKIKLVDPFLVEYFSGKSKLSKANYFKSNLNCSDELSENNSVCKEIEIWTNYILGSDEIRKERRENRQQYRFYIDKTEFTNLTKKEESLNGKLSYTNKKIDNSKIDNDDLVIDFLLKTQGNKKKSKALLIKKEDLKMGDYCSEVLTDYQRAIDFIDKAMLDIKTNPNSKYKGQRFILTKMKKDLYYDMLYCKEHLRGIFGEKLKNQLIDSSDPDWDKFDWHEESHVKELLYMIKDIDPQDDLSNLILSLEMLIKEMNKKHIFTKEEMKIIKLIRLGYRNCEIAEELEIYNMKVKRTVDKIVHKITQYTLDNWKDGSF